MTRVDLDSPEHELCSDALRRLQDERTIAEGALRCARENNERLRARVAQLEEALALRQDAYTRAAELEEAIRKYLDDDQLDRADITELIAAVGWAAPSVSKDVGQNEQSLASLTPDHWTPDDRRGLLGSRSGVEAPPQSPPQCTSEASPCNGDTTLRPGHVYDGNVCWRCRRVHGGETYCAFCHGVLVEGRCMVPNCPLSAARVEPCPNEAVTGTYGYLSPEQRALCEIVDIDSKTRVGVEPGAIVCKRSLALRQAADIAEAALRTNPCPETAGPATGTKVLIPARDTTAGGSRLGKVVGVLTRVQVQRRDGTVGHYEPGELEAAHHCWEPDCEACTAIDAAMPTGGTDR